MGPDVGSGYLRRLQLQLRDVTRPSRSIDRTPMDGVLVVDKPAGPDVARRRRARCGGRSAHAHRPYRDARSARHRRAAARGRPARRGWRRSCSGDDKEYVADVRLGLATDTYDAGRTALAPAATAAAGIDADAHRSGARRASAAHISSCRRPSPPRRSTASPAYKLARQERGRRSSTPVEVTVAALDARGVRARAGARCASSARPGSTSGRWPTTSGSGLAAALTSRRCGGRGRARSPESRTPSRSTHVEAAGAERPARRSSCRSSGCCPTAARSSLNDRGAGGQPRQRR